MAEKLVPSLGEGQDGLSYGGEREGADDSILSNSFVPSGKVRMGLNQDGYEA